MAYLAKIKQELISGLQESLTLLLKEKDLIEANLLQQVALEKPARADHGDFACNAALIFSKTLAMPPRKIAEKIVEGFDYANNESLVEKIEIAGPGFINIFLKRGWLNKVLYLVEEQGESYGKSSLGQGQKVQVEFVSANPTGPLHIGHSRGAVVGDALSRILAFCGYEVEKEFYINNAGKQIELLGKSIFLRLREQKGEKIDFPAECYQGHYINELAQQILQKYGDSLDIHPIKEREALCREFGYKQLMQDIEADLKAYDVKFDVWFSERDLHEEGAVAEALNVLRRKKFIYDKDGAVWFSSSKFGDEKDRVVIKSDGDYTYFANDIAYHYNKLQRGFDLIIDILGADHHGHIARMKAAVEAFGYNPQQLEILILQIVNLFRDGEKIPMSKRAGEFVTMRDVLKEVGKDAARYFYLTRSPDATIDFDLAVAKEQSTKNPVYYLQYAHARICSLFERAKADKLTINKPRKADISVLKENLEQELMRQIARFPEVIADSGQALSPHFLTVYGHDLAGAFHTFYNQCPILNLIDSELKTARLALVWSTQRVLKNLFALLGISAPEKM